MVTLSSLVVMSSLFTQGVSNGKLNSSLKLIDIFFFFIILRLYFVFLSQLILFRVRRWLKGIGKDLEATEQMGHKQDADKDSAKVASMEETAKTHLEGESHHVTRRGHKRVTVPGEGWAKRVMPRLESMETKNRSVPPSSPRSSFEIRVYRFATKYSNKFRVSVYYAWAIINFVTFTIFMNHLFNNKYEARAKFNEYCDTNLEQDTDR